ncbi:COG1470 family protein [Spirosoma lituiforme]
MFSSQAYSQAVQVTFLSDTIVTTVGTTFTNRLTLNNRSGQRQELSLLPQLPPAIQLLSTIPEKVSLLPGQAMELPVKGLVDNQASLPVNRIAVRISGPVGFTAQTHSFALVLSGKRQSAITLYKSEETIVLFSPTQQARLSLRLVHNRIRPEKFTIEVASLPEGVDRSAYPLSLQLAPSQDTTMLMRINPVHQWSTSQPYQVVITVRDEQKSIVGNMVYKVAVAIDNKRYVDANPDTRGGYGASTALTRFSTNQWAREARIWGTDSLGKGQIDFHIHYLNYGSDHFQQLQNSYITYRTDRAMIHLGSSYDYHELPLFGRGLKVNVGQSDRQWTFWAINANPNWLSPDDNGWTGNVFSVRYDRQLPSLPGGSYSLSSSYYTQANTMRAGYLNFASFRYDQSERHSLQVLGSQSVEFARQGPDRAQKPGWAGQLQYEYQSPKLTWQLRSYVSSPAYSGLQKGATLIYSQLFWQASAATTLLARVNSMGYNRIQFTSGVDYTQHKFGNTTAEVNLSHRIQQLTLSVRPYWLTQRDFDNPISQRADAYRLAPALSYYRRSHQRFELSYDAGIFYNRTAASPQSGWLSQRIVSSISLGAFHFWGYLQKGPYYLFDLRNNQPDRIMTASLTPTIDFSLFDRKLVGSIGLNYLYDAFNEESRYVGVGRVQYDVSPGLSVNLSGNGTPYSQHPEFSYSLYRLEVAKRFNKLASKHRSQLRLSFFEDANGNGNKEAGERWMDSLMVTVDENTLLTNTKGSITYRNIPPGIYTISAISANRVGDPVLHHEKITIAGSVNKQIPLARTFRITGKLRCQASTYDTQPCQFDRFVIEIQRDEQTILSASALPDGSFSVHLSPGNYTIRVRDFGRQPQATVKTVAFTLTESGQYPVFDWTIDGSTRPVEVKRFSSL